MLSEQTLAGDEGSVFQARTAHAKAQTRGNEAEVACKRTLAVGEQLLGEQTVWGLKFTVKDFGL